MPVDYLGRWYVIRTEPRFEKIVRDQLTGRGVETLLPLRTRTSQWKSGTKLIEAPLLGLALHVLARHNNHWSFKLKSLQLIDVVLCYISAH